MILFFGPPGSGKSVQGQLLVERNDWQWLSTGEIFRSSKDPEVLKRLASGELIDDELTNKVLDTAIQAVEKDTVVLDGYPRNVDQSKWLQTYLPKVGRKVDCVVLFQVPREELIQRLSGRGRAEDTPEVINRRLDIYDEKTSPVVDYFRDYTDVPVIVIDGTGEIPEIHERIQVAVMACLKTK